MWPNFLKNTFEWIEWVNLIVEDLFILQPYEKVNSFRDFVKGFSPEFENTSGYLHPKRFLYDQKTCFFLLAYCRIYLLLNKQIFHVPMFQLYMWQKSLTNICEGFHLCKVEKKKKKSWETLDQFFIKECFSLYTGTVPVPFRQTFPLTFFFFFSLY